MSPSQYMILIAAIINCDPRKDHKFVVIALTCIGILLMIIGVPPKDVTP